MVGKVRNQMGLPLLVPLMLIFAKKWVANCWCIWSGSESQLSCRMFLCVLQLLLKLVALPALYLLLGLIFCCSLLLPLVTWEVIGWIGVDTNASQSLSMYGFLYGTFPTAPSVFLFASQYGVAQDIVSLCVCLYMWREWMEESAFMSV